MITGGRSFTREARGQSLKSESPVRTVGHHPQFPEKALPVRGFNTALCSSCWLNPPVLWQHCEHDLFCVGAPKSVTIKGHHCGLTEEFLLHKQKQRGAGTRLPPE